MLLERKQSPVLFEINDLFSNFAYKVIAPIQHYLSLVGTKLQTSQLAMLKLPSVNDFVVHGSLKAKHQFHIATTATDAFGALMRTITFDTAVQRQLIAQLTCWANLQPWCDFLFAIVAFGVEIHP